MIETIIDAIIGLVMFFFVAIFGSIATLLSSGLDYLDLGSNVEYTKIVKGKNKGANRDGDSIYYNEYVLVRNAPKNDFEQSKMMLTYFDNAGSSPDDISRMPGITDYYMSFYKSTYASRKYFIEASKYWAEKTRTPDSWSKGFDEIVPEVYLGTIHIFRCDSSPVKWVIEFYRKTGISEDGWIVDEATILQNECGTHFDYAKKNEELVKYYIELKEKSNGNENKNPLKTNNWVTISDQPAFAYNSFFDLRDGKSYKTVKIGKQVWMAENLNYEAKGSKCYKNEPANCKQYGKLYNWNTAIKACPKDWHLPSNAEWNVLMKYVNPNCLDNEKCGGAGTKLKATSGWNYNGNGEDAYGFAALPGGFCYSNGYFVYIGNGGTWWSASENGADLAYYRNIAYDYGIVYYNDVNKADLLSVRCVQD